MTHRERIQNMAEASGGVFRTSDLKALGYNTYAIRKLVNEKVIERVKSGYYRLSESSQRLSEAAQIAQLFPDGVLCMYTALFYYRYGGRSNRIFHSGDTHGTHIPHGSCRSSSES